MLQPLEILRVEIIQCSVSGGEQNETEKDASLAFRHRDCHQQVEEGERNEEPAERPLQLWKVRFPHQQRSQQHGSPKCEHARLNDELERIKRWAISQQKPFDRQTEE